MENVSINDNLLVWGGKVRDKKSWGNGKLEDEKLFCLVKKKNESIENIISINLFSCPYYIIYKKIQFII